MTSAPSMVLTATRSASRQDADHGNEPVFITEENRRSLRFILGPGFSEFQRQVTPSSGNRAPSHRHELSAVSATVAPIVERKMLVRGPCG